MSEEGAGLGSSAERVGASVGGWIGLGELGTFISTSKIGSSEAPDEATIISEEGACWDAGVEGGGRVGTTRLAGGPREDDENDLGRLN